MYRRFHSINHAIVYRYYSCRKRKTYLVRIRDNHYLEFRSYGRVLDFLRNVRDKIKASAKKSSHSVYSYLIKLFNLIWQLIPSKLQNKILELKHSIYVFFKRVALFVKNSYLFDIFILGSSIFSIGLKLYAFSLLKSQIGHMFEYFSSRFGELGFSKAFMDELVHGLEHYFGHTVLHRAAFIGLATAEELEALSHELEGHSTPMTATLAVFIANKINQYLDKSKNKILGPFYEILSDLGYIAKKIAQIILKVFVFILQIVVLYVLPLVGSLYFGYQSLKRILEVISLRSFFFKEFVQSDFMKDIDENIKKDVENFINKLSFDIISRDPVTINDMAKLIDLSSLNYIDGAVYAAVNDDSDELFNKIKSHVKSMNIDEKSKEEIKLNIANKYADYLIQEVFSKEAAEKIVSKITEFISQRVGDMKQREKIIEKMKKIQEKYSSKYGQLSRETLVDFIARNTIFEISLDVDSGLRIVDISCDNIMVSFSKRRKVGYRGVLDLRTKYRLYSIVEQAEKLSKILTKYFSEGKLDDQDVKALDNTIETIDGVIQETIKDGVEVDKKYEVNVVRNVFRGMKTFFSSNTMRIKVSDIEGIVQVPGEKCKEVRYKMNADITIPMVFGTLLEKHH